MILRLFCFFLFLVCCLSSTSVFYVKNEFTDGSCIFGDTLFYIPLLNDVGEEYTLCTTYFSDDVTVKFSYNPSSPSSLGVEEYEDSPTCEPGKLKSSNTFSFGDCITSDDSIFKSSIFSSSSEPLYYLNGIENENDYLVTTSFSSSSTCNNGDDTYTEIIITNSEIGENNEAFLCNSTIFTTFYPIPERSDDFYITKVQKIIPNSGCFHDTLSERYWKFDCVDQNYFSEEVERLTHDEFMIVNIYEGSECEGAIEWQDIIRNGQCFPLDTEYQKNLFQSLIEDTLGIEYQEYNSVFELFREDVNTLYFEVYNNTNCEDDPFFGRLFHPTCNPFQGHIGGWLSELMTSDWDKHSLLRETGRITVFNTDSCSITTEELEEMIMRDIINNQNFDFITSVSHETCINSFFEFYTGDDSTSMYGICDEVNEPKFVKFPSSDTCVDVELEITDGNMCMEGTNHGSSAWFTCLPNTCFGVNQYDDEVCSENGFCVDTDVCKCKSGYKGKECEDKDNSSVIALSIILPLLFLAIFAVLCCFSCVFLLFFMCFAGLGVAGFLTLLLSFFFGTKPSEEKKSYNYFHLRDHTNKKDEGGNNRLAEASVPMMNNDETIMEQSRMQNEVEKEISSEDDDDERVREIENQNKSSEDDDMEDIF